MNTLDWRSGLEEFNRLAERLDAYVRSTDSNLRYTIGHFLNEANRPARVAGAIERYRLKQAAGRPELPSWVVQTLDAPWLEWMRVLIELSNLDGQDEEYRAALVTIFLDS